MKGGKGYAMSSFLNSILGALGGADKDGAPGKSGSPLGQIAQIALQNPQLLQVVAAMFTAGNKHGGLQGMLQKFTQAGLGDTAQSWIGEGENRPVTPRQIEEVFGEAGIERIAAKSGTSRAETPDLLSQILPSLINGLSPGGREPPRSEAPQSADALIGMLGGLLGRR